MNHPSASSKHIPGGAVVVVAIIGETKILLIKETTKPLPHYWKLVSETVEPGEPILNTLWGGVREEAGLNLEVRRLGGQVVEIVDPRIKVTKQLMPSHMVRSHTPHRRHFWGLVTSDELIDSLSGKRLVGDVNEAIETLAFSLADLEGMMDFLPHHRELIKGIQ